MTMTSPDRLALPPREPGGAHADGGVPVEPSEPGVRGWSRLLARQEIVVFGVLVAMCLTFGIWHPSEFATGANFRGMALDASDLILLALGMTFVIATAGIDLSIGSVLIFSSIVAIKAMNGVGTSGLGVALVGLVAGVGAGAAWGVLNGILIAGLRLPPLIVTLATLGAALGASQLLTGGAELTSVPADLNDTIGYGSVLGIPDLALIAASVTAIGGLSLATTRFGRRTCAIGSNSAAARKAGIPTARHLAIVYTLMGALAGTAGFLSIARFGTTSIGGHTTDALTAVTAVILGGASLFGGSGTVVGTAIGVCIPTVLANGLVIVGIPAYWQPIAVAIVLLMAVYADRHRRDRQQRS
jgi:ribose transport system permease protein